MHQDASIKILDTCYLMLTSCYLLLPPSMSVKLSAVIITLNEERNIERCLKSLQGIADEIVVIDSFSNDRTEELCRGYGVKFIQHPFAGYASQKNYGLQSATNDD